MAQTTIGGSSSQAWAVISREYCSPHPIELTISRNVWKMDGNRYVIKDLNDNIMFKVQRLMFLIGPYTRLIFDASERPIVTLKKKTFTAHRRWQAFRGESTDERDLIFSAKQSSHVPFRTKLHVFLANNTSEEYCDYSLKAGAFISSGEVYIRETSNKIARMEREFSFFGKEKYMVTVYPNVDHAFVVALIIILDEINLQKQRDNN